MSLAPHLETGIDIKRLNFELSAICSNIVSQFEPVEKTFLEVGGALNQLCDDVANLSDSARKTADETTERLHLDALPKVSHASKTLLDDLGFEQGKIEKSLVAIQSISSSLSGLHQSVTYLHGVARRLDNIRLYIEIESSRSAATQESFSSFTEEMQKLGEMVVQTCSSLTHDEAHARSEQDQAYAEISSGLADLTRMTQEGQGASKQAVDSIGNVLTQTSESLVRVSVHSEAVGQLVNRIVQALQFHDITRQQLEHVVEALKDACSMSQFSHEDSSEGTLRIARIIQIQQAHVLEAIASVNRVHQEIAASFDEAKTEVQLLIDSLPNVCQNKAGSNGQSPFVILQQKTDQLLALQQHSKDLDTRAGDTAKSATQATTILSSHVNDVRRISQDMELRAFNAAVKSAKLGEDGRTLKILSEEVTKLSVGSKNFVDTTVENLNAITEASAQLVSTLRPSDQDASEEIELQELMQIVHEATEDLKKSCFEITQSASDVQHHITHCRHSISFLDHFSAILTNSSDHLSKCIEMLRPEIGNVDLLSVEAEEQLSDRYTMESERNVHRLFVSDDSPKDSKDETNVAEGGCILF